MICIYDMHIYDKLGKNMKNITITYYSKFHVLLHTILRYIMLQ